MLKAFSKIISIMSKNLMNAIPISAISLSPGASINLKIQMETDGGERDSGQVVVRGDGDGEV